MGNEAKTKRRFYKCEPVTTSAGTAYRLQLIEDGDEVAQGLVSPLEAEEFGTRWGTGDIDSVDYAQMFLENEDQTDPSELSDFYVLENFRPVVTKKNWRMDCGVAAYDNTFGLPPFFPTHLRCEDYIYRLWVQQEGFAAAHVDAAQNHVKSNYMRNPPASEILNEEVSNLLKGRIRSRYRGSMSSRSPSTTTAMCPREMPRRSWSASAACMLGRWRWQPKLPRLSAPKP